jgi:hypothetical protein
VSAGEHRLAALERVLVGAAAEQAVRRQRRRRRTAVLAALAAPLVLAAAGSMAATGFFDSVDTDLATLRDERLDVRAGAISGLASAAGSRPRAGASGRSWIVGGKRVIGYTTPNGRFCFRFVGFTGGCLSKHALSAKSPLAPMIDNRPGEFRVYGLAMDGVVAVSLQAHGVTRPAIVGPNAFFLEVPSLGSRRSFLATLIARFSDGTTRRQPIRVGGFDSGTAKPLPALPGLRPAEDAAA